MGTEEVDWQPRTEDIASISADIKKDAAAAAAVRQPLLAEVDRWSAGLNEAALPYFRKQCELIMLEHGSNPRQMHKIFDSLLLGCANERNDIHAIIVRGDYNEAASRPT